MSIIPAIEINDLTISYDSRLLIEGFDLSLVPGEKVILTGSSGSGKSTLLHSLLGFVPVDKGWISIFGQLLDPVSVWNLRKYISFVPQEPDLGTGTVEEVINKPLHYRCNRQLQDNLRSLPELFERFYLNSKLLTQDIRSVSGGEKQRIALIIAIIQARPVFLLDEFTSAMDSASKQAVAGFLAEQKDKTVLAVAHETENISWAKRVVSLT